MSGSFISQLPQAAKVWSAKAIAGIIVADGIVTNAELTVLRESIGFLEDVSTINEIVELVKDRVKPELQVLKTDRKIAAKILMSLAMVALTDNKLSASESQYFIYIAGKLGFEAGIAKMMMSWGRDYISLNEKKKVILRIGEESKPMYVNI
ncbi:MAG: hypothetical protein COB67_01600 [SAR324 cluster bacterium]|uniref:TerB family tellurite resistance protein n=1 Tax=SAR324 cluster bacterium TaxID=2024889 RepID=A0A2A4TAE0_9DELT|nr:MAG: hypothetical protein COB67_01600 [SAR324 cluster bacterium]